MNDYEKRIYNSQTETELFTNWQIKSPVTINYKENTSSNSYTINHANVFISDGIVNNESWYSGRHKKIAYILKEAYGEKQNWSLTKWLAQTKPTTLLWKRVIEWTYGIQNTTAETIAAYSSAIYETNRHLFEQIAVVNLKKSNGKSASSSQEIEAYAVADQVELRKQLEIIAPDIIICGSTFQMLNRIYDHKIRPQGVSCENWFYFSNTISANTTLVIDYYHPANHYPSLVNYYAVVNIYQQALKYQKREKISFS